jgi:hypothetical protein
MGNKMNRERDSDFMKWSREVKIRDRFECQICSLLDVLNKETYLESHHLFAWNAWPQFRYDIDLGVTLCSWHHHQFHCTFNYGDNTKDQFEQFIKIIQLFEKIIKDPKKEE